QRLKDMAIEPGVDLVQHGLRHLLLAAREKVIEAPLAQAGLFSDAAQRCSLIAELAEDFGNERNDVGALIESPHAVGLLGSKAKIREPRVIIGATAERPVKFAVRFPDRQIVDAGEAALHQARSIILPVLIAI